MLVMELRYWRNAPRLVSFALAALLAAESVHAVVTLWRVYRSTPATPPVARSWRRTAEVDVQAIQAAHLFGVVESDAAGDPAAAPLSKANLALMGTVATKNPAHGFAIITSDGSAKVYRVGEDVEGASLYAVYLDRVTLKRSGSYETLLLPRFQGTGPDSHAPARVARSGAGGRAPEESPKKLAEIMQPDPWTDDDSGKLLGYRIRPGGDHSIFTHAGLRPGDLLTAVNGTPLADQDPKSTQETVNAMLASGRANVSIVRNGKHLDLTLDLEQ